MNLSGHHIVKAFPFWVKEEGYPLPEGWKPFAYDPVTGHIICRKWVRNEKEESDA